MRLEPGFQYRGGRLHCERVPVEEIAAAAGTPAYIYSRSAIERNFRRFDAAFADFPHTICYSVKACPNIAILRVMAEMGAGFDIVSAGELRRVEAAGGDRRKTVFSGVGKTAAEMDAALEAGILMFNVESDEEMKLLARRARAARRRAPAAIRVNPDVAAETHPYIATGARRHKFGVEWEHAEQLYDRAGRTGALEMVGITCHIGSQILALEPFYEALERLLEMAGRLRRRGFDIRYIDLGGGIGVAYRQGEQAPDVAAYARGIAKRVPAGYHMIIEPGRAVVGESGILVTQVLYRKRNGRKNFVVVDAAMNDLLRPALYGSYHEIRPVHDGKRRQIVADVVGPVCESGDFLAQDRTLPAPRAGELLAVFTTGAYAASAGSNYNSRPRPPEVLVEGRRFRVIRERESLEDLFRTERV